MTIMGYCRHEVVLGDLREVWDKWYEFNPEDASEHEVKARENLIRLIKEMAKEID